MNRMPYAKRVIWAINFLNALREDAGSKNPNDYPPTPGNISFILHRPQLSENIGACARAIKNFSFSKLLLINPKPIFPNDKILATSVGAKDIIKKANVFNNIEDSLNKLDILIATSARFRNKNISHITLADLNKIDFSKKIGFLINSRNE